MKNSLKNLKLWQQKRSELPVDENPQAGWAQMQSLLNTHLPAGKPVPKITPHGTGYFKLLSLLVATSAVTVAVYFAVHKGITKQHSHHTKPKTTLNKLTAKDTLATDSLTPNGTLVNKTDSVAAMNGQAETGTKANENLTTAAGKATPGVNKAEENIAAEAKKSSATAIKK